MTADKPLRDIVVLDMSQGIAGPSCGGHFAAYGARVIKIEPPTGDWIRKLGAQIVGTSPTSIVHNRGKESLAVDLKTDAGREIALKLGERADVVIESARPGVMERLGLGFGAFRERNPAVIYLSISGYGQRGPMREAPMVDTVGQAYSGLMSATRARDGAPVKNDATLIDAITGLYAFQAASMALWGGKTPRIAQHLDISLLQSAAHVQAPHIMEWSVAGKATGVLNPPAGNYPTADGWIAITLVTEAQYHAICRGLSRADLMSDPRFATFADRRANVAALRDEIDASLKTRTTLEWAKIFTDEGALAAPINTYGDWLDDHHVKAVGAAPSYELPTGDTVPLPHLPGGVHNDAAVPIIGEHSRAVLGELGFTRDEIDDLVDRGVIVDLEAD